MPGKVVIVGGGLVGSLTAIFMAKRGCHVHVFEKRPDIRQDKSLSGKSINLALSERGIAALEAAGIADDFKSHMIPMKGRLIHAGGNLSSQPYGIFGECINSIDRKWINQRLLSIADAYSNVTLHFNHALESCSFDNSTIVFKSKDGKAITVKNVDLVIGSDGAYSAVRYQLMKHVRMDFSQLYIDHAYLELCMPPTEAGEYAMASDHLHIWPRQTFMMIALPNLDKSFTVTLFMPWSKFESIKTEDDLMQFFESVFPDSIPLLGRQALAHDFFKNERGALVTVKCKPYHYKDKAVILGDAAHAMVPFCTLPNADGQGMNCGFEDVLVLNEIWDKVSKDDFPSSEQLEAILSQYSKQRNPDAEAMCDLAMYNYIEMRSSVTKPKYIIRNKLERFLHRFLPQTVIPLYTMVSFSRTPYSQALQRFKRQTWWFDAALNAVSLSVAFVGLAVVWRRVPFAQTAARALLDATQSVLGFKA